MAVGRVVVVVSLGARVVVVVCLSARSVLVVDLEVVAPEAVVLDRLVAEDGSGVDVGLAVVVTAAVVFGLVVPE